MEKKLKNIILIAIMLAGGILTLYSCGKGGDNDIVPDDNENPPVEEEFPIDENKTFVHPGLLLSQSDFTRIKAKVDAGAEPWISGWNKLTGNSHASLNYSPNPVVKLIRGGNSTEEPEADNYSRAMNDVAAAYQLAIRWKITGDVAYANKSIQILNAWASTCTSISGNSNKALGAGIYGYQFANAAEIMRTYDGWSSADFGVFKQWMLDVFYPVNKAFIDTHWGTCISHYWANWDLCNLASLMSIGVLTDRADIYNYAIKYLIEGEGNGHLKKAVYYIHPDGLGQLQESGRDQGHALLCIGFLGDICEMAWKQGDDLYGYDDSRVLKGAEYAARYNFNLGSVSFEPYNNCDNVNHTVISETARGNARPIWEVIYNHYVKRQKMTAPNVTLVANIHRPEGGGGDYGPNSGGFDSLGFGTLLFTRE
ncbi:alginate lyase family protein [Gaoshiqia sediminis]|uniref:Alginate lyase family protein n=1 Tax=Gaoshiqia sediminis TaxID=2986998 RepID=A0AA41Y2S2_9BACT|nr:alginate lyase family protein [Gaoshiqia sediminis]MCW0482384.1 alginate lyase family protein [Gaoshiqia sediminis]